MAKQSKYENDQALLELVMRIKSGEVTRAQAAEIRGVGYTSLMSQIAFGKMKHLLEDAPRKHNPKAFQPIPPDSDKAKAYEKAITRARELKSVKRAFNEINTPELNLNYVILCRKVAEVKGKTSKLHKIPETTPVSTESVRDFLARKANIQLIPK